MTNVLTAAAFVLLVAGTATAQQKPAKPAKTNKMSTGKQTANEAMRSSPSAENTHDGTGGVSVGLGSAPVGTGLTNDQNQAASSNVTTGTTKVDARSSIRTGASPIKAKKKAPGSGN